MKHCLFVMALVCLTSTAWAQSKAKPQTGAIQPQLKPEATTTAQAKPAEPSTTRRVLATGAAVVPGLLIHGSGHFAVGETKTGWRLLIAQGVGIGMVALGGAGLVASGAADQLNAPSIWLATGGAGLFLFSWGADLYGTLTLGRGAGGPVRQASVFEVEQGYQFVQNPALEGAHFSRTSLIGRWGHLAMQGRAWFALDDAQYRLEFGSQWRLGGPRPNHRARDGSFADLHVGFARHRYDFGATETLGELALRGRYDLIRMAPTLNGMFVQGGFGVGFGTLQYDALTSEFTTMLLSEVAIGLYLGHARDGFSEVSLFYDHRHDGFAAGTKVTGLGSGAIGSAGVRLRLGILENWGLSLLGQAGSAYVVNANVVYRMGGSR